VRKIDNAVATSSLDRVHILIVVFTIPNHKEIAKGTLRAVIREVGLTVDEFKALL
jgi:hypothetical protein